MATELTLRPLALMLINLRSCEAHLRSASLLDGENFAASMDAVSSRLIECQEAAGFDTAWRETWWHGLPTCYEIDGGCNIPIIVWVWMLYKSYGMLWYARERYAQLEQGQRGKGWKRKAAKNPLARVGDWTPGRDGSRAPVGLSELLRRSGNPYSHRIAQIVAECHATLGAQGIKGIVHER